MPPFPVFQELPDFARFFWKNLISKKLFIAFIAKKVQSPETLIQVQHIM